MCCVLCSRPAEKWPSVRAVIRWLWRPPRSWSGTKKAKFNSIVRLPAWNRAGRQNMLSVVRRWCAAETNVPTALKVSNLCGVTSSLSGTAFPCSQCKTLAVPQFHLAMVDGTIRNFCSLICVTTYRVQLHFILGLFHG